MVIKELYDAGKFVWKDLGFGKFVRKNAGKFIGSVVKRLPDRWKNNAITAGEYAAEKARNILGKDNEIVENITAGVKEAKGIGNEFKNPLDSKNEKSNVPQSQSQAMPQPQSQVIQYVNSLGKAKHIRLRRRINRPPLARNKARLKLNSAKFASKRRTTLLRGRNIKFYKINER